jgi:HEAT repeat protein
MANEWLEELTEPDARRNQTALDAFSTMGKAASPLLKRALEARDSPVDALLIWVAARVPRLGLRVKPAADLHLAALEAMTVARDESLVPELTRFLEGSVGTSAKTGALQARTAVLLGGYGAAAESAVPALLRLIRTDAGQGGASARAALEAINRIGGDRELVGPVLVECLQSSDERLRRLAASGLGGWGSDAAFALGSLRKALWAPNASVFPEVATALGSIGTAAREAAPDLLRGLNHESAMVRATAAASLARVGSDPAVAVPALVESLQDEDPYVRSRVAWALGRFGADAAAAVQPLAIAVHDGNEAVQIPVIEALGEIGPVAANAVADLNRARSNRQAGLGRYVMTALERIENRSEATESAGRATSTD